MSVPVDNMGLEPIPANRQYSYRREDSNLLVDRRPSTMHAQLKKTEFIMLWTKPF